MGYLAKKWTKEKPYIYIDYTYPRRMVMYWEGDRKVVTQYARWLYEKEVGEIPLGHDIHHINEDKLDDRVENYELQSHGSHSSMHHKKRGKRRKYG